MGTWATRPWEKDAAADWYDDFMDVCQIRKQWLLGMRASCHFEPEVVRAAISIFIMLGHVHIWLIDDYDSDLDLAIFSKQGIVSA